jgi:hypothetical protein
MSSLSRVEKLEASIDYQDLAASQEHDQELRELRQGASSLQLKQVQIPGNTTPVTCDISTATARPFVTPEFRRAAFDTVHRLSHP